MGLLVLALSCLGGCSERDTTGTIEDQMVHEFTTTTLEGQPMLGDGPENPAPLGVAMSVGGWNIAVTGRDVQPVTQNADEGRVLVAVSVTATYVRNPGAGHFFDDVRITALDSAGERHDLAQEECLDELEHAEPAEPGDDVQGTLCFDVAGDMPDLQLVVAALGQPTAHVVYLATR